MMHSTLNFLMCRLITSQRIAHFSTCKKPLNFLEILTKSPYIMCIQYRGGDILSTVGDTQYRDRYHAAHGGYHEYGGGVQYGGGYNLLLFEYPYGT